MSTLALPPPTKCTSTVYVATNTRKSPRAPDKSVRERWQTFFRSTQAQGDCLYLCMIGHLQAEDPLARAEHLDMFKRHCVEKNFGVSEPDLDAMFESWGGLNVKNPGSDVPVPEVSALRELVSKFFEHHFAFYYPKDDDDDDDDDDALAAPPPLWMTNQNNLEPQPENYIEQIKDELKLVNKHYQVWRGGAPIVLDPNTRDPKVIKKAFANKIRRRYPNDDPFGDRTFSEAQAAQQGINLSLGPDLDMVNISEIHERTLNNAGNVEIHVMANMFGVNVNVFSTLSNGLLSDVEAHKMNRGIVAKVKAATSGNAGTPWALIARNATHFDFLETAKFNTNDHKRRGYGGSHGEDAKDGSGDGGGGGLAGWGNNLPDAKKHAVRAATAASRIARYARDVKAAAEKSSQANELRVDFEEQIVREVETLYARVIESAKASLQALPDSPEARSAISDAEDATNAIEAMVETAGEVTRSVAAMPEEEPPAGAASSSAGASSSSAGASSSSAGAASSSAGAASSSVWAGAFSSSAGASSSTHPPPLSPAGRAKRAKASSHPKNPIPRFEDEDPLDDDEDSELRLMLAATAMFQLTQALRELVTRSFAQRARLARVPFDALASADAIAAAVLKYTTDPSTANNPIAHAQLRLVALQATRTDLNFDNVNDVDDYINIIVDNALQMNYNDPEAAGAVLQVEAQNA